MIRLVIYLLDGYNVAHWLLSDQDDLLPEHLRAGLLGAIEQHHPPDAEALDVYLDVRGSQPLVPANEYRGLVTVHNVPDADAALVDRVGRAQDPRRLCVVSRDREVSGRCRQLGATTLTPGGFFEA